MLKGATIHFYCLFDQEYYRTKLFNILGLLNHIFQTSVLIMECMELNWLCKRIKKIRSNQAAIPVLNWMKLESFPVSLRLNRFQESYTQPAFTCSKLTIETLKKVWNMFKVNNKDTFEKIKRLKSLQKAEVYLEPMRASTMELFCEYTYRLYIFVI